MGLRARTAVIVLASWAVACASSSAMRAAERGDLAALRAELVARERAASIGNKEAADLARAVATREILSAKPADAVTRVHEVRGCARDLDDALESRAKTHDRAGGEAALARVESDAMSASDAREFVKDADDAWRAVGARGLVRAEDRAARQAAMKDPAPEVRRAAMAASFSADDEADVDALAEAARLDPDPLARTAAVRALGFMIGGPRAVAALRDLASTTSDDGLAEDVAISWTSPAVFGVGGREELRLLVASGRGRGAIAGAAAALRTSGPDEETRASARALLARTIETAGRRDKLHALAVAPLEPPILAAVRVAAKDDDIDVRISAFARLAERPEDRSASVAALEAIAGDHDRPAGAARAKMALAVAGDRRIQAWLEADLASTDVRVRMAALSALASLSLEGRGAILLADADASVRTRAACTILSAAHR